MRDWCDCFHPLYLDVPEARGVLVPRDLTSSGEDEHKLPSPFKEVFVCLLLFDSFFNSSCTQDQTKIALTMLLPSWTPMTNCASVKFPVIPLNMKLLILSLGSHRKTMR